MANKKLALASGLVIGLTTFGGLSAVTGLSAVISRSEFPYICTDNHGFCLKDSYFDGIPDTIETSSVERSYDLRLIAKGGFDYE